MSAIENELRLSKNLVWGLAHLGAGEPGDLNKTAAIELLKILDKDEYEILEFYWNALVFNDDEGEPLGWKAADDIFQAFVDKYPNITKALKIYVYA